MMKTVPLLLLFLLFILPQTSAEIICEIEGTWKLSFDITNTNPYTVFIAVPDEIYFFNKPLGYSGDFLKLDIIGTVTTNKNIEDYYTTLNGETGIWIPPYTTVRIYKDGNFSYNLSTSETQAEFKVVPPALMDTTEVFDETQLKSLYKYGIVVNNYRLYVNGKITKSPDTKTVSIIIPAPLVLKDYSSFYKFIGKYDVDIWTDSYRKYVDKHKTLKKYSKLNTFIDYTLVPNMDNDPIDMDINLKLFDVPAMVFTTDNGEIKPLEFSYVMYK
ncbi:hypothetical protein [Methanofervidicoccus abyssi]|uniref:Uncharacterized protein n=1 Tax=Methanofervidicoccus abyssi TaxID=2082189 RepID=A0A401HPI6_9EURY|nr:hypothetical protein [Methanofervidicoccus abyssi]GBF36168.1 hypothetical protein MHHB_P0393 [Methanofervidicoccus abyssi]